MLESKQLCKGPKRDNLQVDSTVTYSESRDLGTCETNIREVVVGGPECIVMNDIQQHCFMDE